MHSILVKDYMNHNPHAINENTPIRDVVQRLILGRLAGAPVIDEANQVVGFVSEQDCIKEVMNDVFFCEDSISVKNVMNRNVLTVTPDTSIFEVAENMSKQAPKNFPVVHNGRLIGIISRTQILQALLETSEDCYIHH